MGEAETIIEVKERDVRDLGKGRPRSSAEAARFKGRGRTGYTHLLVASVQKNL